MLKDYLSKIRVYGYYMSDTDLPRPILGILLDSILLIVVFFTALYLWLVYRTKSPILSLLLCLVVTTLFGFAVYLRKVKIYKRNRQQKRKSLARQYMLDTLSKLSKQEFEWQLIRALEGFKELSNIEQKQGYLRGNYDNMPIAIGYYHSPPGGYESYERLWTFYKSLRPKGFRYFLYISSGSFEESCRNILKRNQEDSIYLLDSNDLLDLMEHQSMVPSNDILDYLVDQAIIDNMKEQKNMKNEAPASSKLKKYMMSSILFLAIAFILRSYFLFYFILSILFSVLGLLSLVLSKGKKNIDKESLDR